MSFRRRLVGPVVFMVWYLSLALAASVFAQEFQPPPEQRNLQESLKQSMPRIEIVWNTKFKIPAAIKAIHSAPLKPEAEAIKSFFAEKFGPLYQIKAPDREILAGKIKTEPDGSSSLSLFQRYESVPVYGVSLKLHLDPEKRLQLVLGKWIPGIRVDVKPKLKQDQAVEHIAAYLRKKYTGKKPLPENIKLKPDSIKLVIFNPGIYSGSLTESRLAYHVVIRSQIFFVDAHTGNILYTYSNIQNAKSRNTHNSTQCTTLPGTLIINESGPVGGATPDAPTQNAHNFAGTVYDYYLNTHGRDSFNGSGATIISTVHSGVITDLIFCCLFGLCDCCTQVNAAWFPTLNQMVYGDGGTLSDGRAFNPFPNALDVVAHELTHGVIQHSIFDASGDPVGLDYTGQSGALNESLADFFGAMVDRADWLMGEDLVTAGYPSGALRNMADPTNGGAYDPADPDGSANIGNQPDHMDQYVSGGDVHINSGIHNKVAYLVSEGGEHPRSHIVVKGLGRTVAEKIFYHALTTNLTQASTFLEARAAAESSVQALYPGNTYNYVTVWNAYVACGICDPAIADHCVPKAYPPVISWYGVYNKLFASESDLALFRKYRDDYLLKSDQGSVFTALLYMSSDEALQVLRNNPELMPQASKLIEANKNALKKVLAGKEGVIQNTDEVISFLDQYAKKSPLALRILANSVKREMISKRKERKPFLGFRLK